MKYVIYSILLFATCHLIYAGEYDKEVNAFRKALVETKGGQTNYNTESIDRLKRILNFYEELNQPMANKETVLKKHLKYEDIEQLVRGEYANFLMRENKYNEALREYEAYLNEAKNGNSMMLHWEQYRKAGLCCHFLKRHRKAFEYFSLALKNASVWVNYIAGGLSADERNNMLKNISVLCLNLAWTCFENKEYIYCINWANNFIETNKDDSRGYSCRALAKWGLNDLDGAIKDFRIAGELGDASAFKSIGICEELKRSPTSTQINITDAYYRYLSTYHLMEISNELSIMNTSLLLLSR